MQHSSKLKFKDVRTRGESARVASPGIPIRCLEVLKSSSTPRTNSHPPHRVGGCLAVRLCRAWLQSRRNCSGSPTSEHAARP
eukprot:COSAG03_NODE_259_length_9809_cov_57.854686_7_plen_82_part_00